MNLSKLRRYDNEGTPYAGQSFPAVPLNTLRCFLRGNEFRAAGRRHGVHPRRARGTMPWNNAVRTRGVFTHRDDFLKPACAERGLVRTGIALGRPGLVSTESQSFQNQRPLSSAPSTFQSPPPIPSNPFSSFLFFSTTDVSALSPASGTMKPT